jgi:hypothetical protein
LIKPGKDPGAASDAKVPSSLAELLNGRSDETVAHIIAMLVVHIRPVLAEIFMAARSAIELAEDTGEAQGGLKLDAKGRIVFSTLFGAIQFSSVQAMVGEAHASSVLFFVDGLFRQMKDFPGMDKSREAGKASGGCKLTRGALSR